ncbi:hypothetical protein [Burkholderia pseudomallei]|uniref:Uncharacterized protein n=1 Tax=Burkholderia pseudomallei 1710a TaxID=320371 RepID=A0A0E1W8C2_BURPE|nr:hypothetical protein [Burkholderia pseudomallei]EET08674.1 hypothetical protein BURPS1710A_1768 [Burkholderia pseudomallei 1710a]KGD30252.1 hypothetical protein DP59_5007 [Burkholderia pseudomallei]MCW0010250.1 hypothetical protein [Burkholderia pseudomallei]VUD45627.1 unnamed protein product [Burkholderia pseudomallei]
MRRPVAQADDDAGTRLAYASTQSAAGGRARPMRAANRRLGGAFVASRGAAARFATQPKERRARREGFMLPRTQKNYNSRLAMPPRRPMPHARRPRGPPRRFVRASRAARPGAPAASSPRNCLRRIAPHVAGLFE